MSIITPPYLQKGDKVYILSTARTISKPQIEGFEAILKAKGLQVEYGKSIGIAHHQLAGDDNLRIHDFNEALARKDIKAILCARGGYGTNRIIDQLNLKALQENPKWVCGFSDVTFIHSILSNTNIASLHTAMPSTFADSEQACFEGIADALMGKAIEYAVTSNSATQALSIDGILVGGNSSILFAQLGTPHQLNTVNRILFIEDLDEYIYHMDRQMIAFKLSGFFRNVQAVIVGGMSDMKDHEIPYGESMEQIIRKNIPSHIPVLFDFPCGHIPKNYPIKLNYPAMLNVEKGKYSFRQG
jgi:muramoyltetrapeptide carboxypeptidase